uniref:Uncharacterized protein n=1 Tax=Nelumbo nucifera TaxID=4432 RepID=A0A822ZN44_NELNU|nr:TPA_asm: hypothetical protein HUJ06_004423 [Nelumbo nucifera]
MIHLKCFRPLFERTQRHQGYLPFLTVSPNKYLLEKKLIVFFIQQIKIDPTKLDLVRSKIFVIFQKFSKIMPIESVFFFFFVCISLMRLHHQLIFYPMNCGNCRRHLNIKAVTVTTKCWLSIRSSEDTNSNGFSIFGRKNREHASSQSFL